MNTQSTVLICDHAPASRQALADRLDEPACVLKLLASMEEVRQWIAGGALCSLCRQSPGGLCLVLNAGTSVLAETLHLLDWMTARQCVLPTVVLSGEDDIETAVKVIKAGAVDYVVMPVSDRKLKDKVRHAAKTGHCASCPGARRQAAMVAFEHLSAREHEVLTGICQGHTTKKIALDLDISTKTVEAHRSHVMAKADVGSLAELVAAYWRAYGEPNLAGNLHP